MDVAGLIQKSRDVKVDYADESMIFTYAPERMDSRMMMRIRTAGVQDLEPLADILAELITHWSLTYEGEPMPIDKDSLLSLPFGLMSDIAGALLEDLNSGKAPTPSVNGSSGRISRTRRS